MPQAHSSVEKAGLIGLVRMRYIESDDDLSMRGEALLEAITHDRAEGLLPFFVSIDIRKQSVIIGFRLILCWTTGEEAPSSCISTNVILILCICLR